MYFGSFLPAGRAGGIVSARAGKELRKMDGKISYIVDGGGPEMRPKMNGKVWQK